MASHLKDHNLKTELNVGKKIQKMTKVISNTKKDC